MKVKKAVSGGGPINISDHPILALSCGWVRRANQ